MAAAEIDFWFTMGSTYSFLSVMRLAEIERSTGIKFRWRPFHLLVILQEMKNVPFADKPIKSAYMWRDIERRAAMYGIPAQLPAPYPPSSQWRPISSQRLAWVKDGVPTFAARPIGAGFSLGKKPAASPTYRRACRILDRTRSACLCWPIPGKPMQRS